VEELEETEQRGEKEGVFGGHTQVYIWNDVTWYVMLESFIGHVSDAFLADRVDTA